MTGCSDVTHHLHPPVAPDADARRGTGRRAFVLRTVAAAMLLLGAGQAFAAGDDIVVILNKDNPNAVDIGFVVRVYTGALKGWPDGSPVFALDQPEDSATREAFCTSVLKKSVANLKAIWSQNIFTGKGLPPRVAGAGDLEMKRLVATNRNAIGYIRASQLDDTVKAVGR